MANDPDGHDELRSCQKVKDWPPLSQISVEHSRCSMLSYYKTVRSEAIQFRNLPSAQFYVARATIGDMLHAGTPDVSDRQAYFFVGLFEAKGN